MIEFIRLLAGTVAFRPYVFVFFAIYIFLAVTRIGWKRTALFTLTAYTIAFVSEYTSSHGDLGIPFGLYRYIESTRGRELWIAGMPFMDSLSFTFLSFISFQMAIFLLSPLAVSARDVRVIELRRVRHSWWTAALAGFLMTYLDIIIDPLTLQGKRWFLGEIYLYPNGGSYFGVTIANFLGWFIVCFLIVRVYVFIEKRMSGNGGARGVMEYPFKGIAPAGLYFGILGFNIAVTFYIGELTMALAGVFITLPLMLLVVMTLWRARMPQPGSATEESTEG